MSDLFGYNGQALVLREYQTRGISMLDDEFAKGKRAPLFVLPTGGGKTAVAVALMDRCVQSGGSALFLAPRRELIHQASKRLRTSGIYHGVILAGEGHMEAPGEPVQVGSIDTMLSRMVRAGMSLDLPDFDLVIVDEAHLSVTERRKELLEQWPNAQIIGLTATPVRKDGRALGMLYDTLVEPVTVKQLTEDGHLVKARYFSLSEPDLHRVRTVAGDYNQKQLEEAVNQAELVGDIVSTWIKHAHDRRTVVFCTSIAHSMAVAEAYLQVGITAEHVDASTPVADRELIFSRFTKGETQVLTNCFLASYGFDLPELSCVVLARPTKSLMLYLQMLGRGLRPIDGKQDCLVLDHSGCVHMHGFAEDERDWTLDGIRDFGDRKEREAAERKEPRTIDCPECNAVFSRSLQCPECGYRLAVKPEDEPTLEGELVEVKADPTFKRSDPRFFQELRGMALERGYKMGWAAYKYKERFGSWPPRTWDSDMPIEPTIETRRWVKSRQIAYAKSREKAAM